MGSRLVVLLILIFAAIFFDHPAWAQAVAEPFAVYGVDVDMTARSANEAKQQALEDGQRKAFQILLERLSAPKDRAHLPKADGTEYVTDYAIQSERASAVRYLATLDVRFNPAAVRKLFKNAGLAMIEPVVHPVVVIPVWHGNGQIQVWEDNPWRATWLSQGKGGLVAMVVPGEKDNTTVTPEQVVAGSEPELQTLGGRYHTNDVVVLTADMSGDGRKLDVVPLVVRGGMLTVPPVTIIAKSGEPQDQMLARAVRQLVQNMEQQVRQSVETNSALPQDAVSAIVPVSGLDEWVWVRDRLSRGGLIRSWDLISLTRSEAALLLHLGGDAAKARAALVNLGFEVQVNDGYWLIKSVRH